MELYRDIAITGLGMVTPVGTCAAQSFASVRSGISRVREHPQFYFTKPDDPDFEEAEAVRAAAISFLDAQRQSEPAKWLARLASLAFRDLSHTAADLQCDPRLGISELRRAGLYLALPAERPSWEQTAPKEFSYHFHNAIECDPFPVEKYSHIDHAGGLTLLAQACQDLQGGSINLALVGGVDCYLFPECLEWLDDQYRLRSPRNLGGFIPGENAAFVLLEDRNHARQRGVRCHGYVEAVSTTRSNTRYDSALSDALAPLLQKAGEAPLICCDLNGEPRRMKEWGLAQVRLGESLGKPPALKHPASSVGDMGAAAGPALLALAANFLKRNRNHRKKNALVWTASDSGERAAALVKTGTEQ